MASISNQSDTTPVWSIPGDDEESNFHSYTGRLRLIVSRAAILYLGLLLGLSTLLSIFGVDPFIRNGLIPKVLLVYVGLATILAVANTQANLAKEQTRGWLALTGKRRLRDG
ncbi:MAG TPA: hypothetical protein VGD99_09900 [Anaerolineae bacterium]|jgi:hypothetical protein